MIVCTLLQLLRHCTHLVMTVPVAVLARGTAVTGHVAAGACFGGLAAAVPALLLQVAALWQKEKCGGRCGVSCALLLPGGLQLTFCAPVMEGDLLSRSRSPLECRLISMKNFSMRSRSCVIISAARVSAATTARCISMTA